MSVQLAKKFALLNIKRCSAPFVANQSKCYSADKMPKGIVVNKDEDSLTVKPSTNLINVNQNECIIPVTGMPLEHTKGRLIRIYKRAKNAMQSGTDNTHTWLMEFDTRERWENPLMGWSASGDPVSNLKIEFPSSEAAAKFAEKNGYEYYIEYERKDKPKPKSYGWNFSWNKRTRVSTK